MACHLEQEEPIQARPGSRSFLSPIRDSGVSYTTGFREDAPVGLGDGGGSLSGVTEADRWLVWLFDRTENTALLILVRRWIGVVMDGTRRSVRGLRPSGGQESAPSCGSWQSWSLALGEALGEALDHSSASFKGCWPLLQVGIIHDRQNSHLQGRQMFTGSSKPITTSPSPFEKQAVIRSRLRGSLYFRLPRLGFVVGALGK